MLREKFGLFDIYLEGYETRQHEAATIEDNALTDSAALKG